LLPAGTFVRRNFYFDAGEKGTLNRWYRRSVDRSLARRHRLTDFFFSLAPLEPLTRVERICSLARHSVVELETHPVQSDEYRFLRDGGILRHGGRIRTLPFSALHTEPASLRSAS